jgi:hypothetical protein
MHRALLVGLVLAFASCSRAEQVPKGRPGAGAAPASPSGVGEVPACVPAEEAWARSAAAQQRNQERYRKAVAAKHLWPITLAEKVVDGDEDGSARPPHVITRKVDGRSVRLLIEQGFESCGSEPGQEFLRSAKLELYAVYHQLRPSRPDYILACGCEQHTQRGCGAAERPVEVQYSLPDGLHYKGVITIEYEAEPTSVLFTGKQPDGTECPPPPPPPP